MVKDHLELKGVYFFGNVEGLEMTNSNIELKKIYKSLRPGKVVTLVLKKFGWRENLLKIIGTYSQIWGGEYNLIVPTDGKIISEEFWYLLKEYDPDYFFTEPGAYNLISERLKKEILERLNPFCEDIMGKNPIIKVLDPKNVYPLTFIRDIIQPNKAFSSIEIPRPNVHFTFSKGINDSLKLLENSINGKIDDKYAVDLNNLGLTVNEVNITSLHELYDMIFEEKKKPDHIFSLSMIDLEKFHKATDYSKVRNAPPIIVVGNSIEDFCFYYNLSRLRNDVLWAPYSVIRTSLIDSRRFLERKVKEKGLLSFNHHFLFAIRDRMEKEENGAILTSLSITKNELKKVKCIFKDSSISDEMLETANSLLISKNIEELLNYKLQVYELNNHPNWYKEQFIDGKALNTIKTPIPKRSKYEFKKQYWITEINIENYVLPQYSNLNRVLYISGYFNPDKRVTKEGFAYFSPNKNIPADVSVDYYSVRPEIKLLKPLEIFQTIFREAGYSIELSDDGIFEKKIIDKFGSLTSASIKLVKEINRNLFDKLIEEKNPIIPEDGISIDKRMYLSANAIRKHLCMNDTQITRDYFIDDLIQKNILFERMTLSRDLILNISNQNEVEIDETEKNKSDELINQLIEQNILDRGFIFKCKECLNADWYNLNEIDDKFSCKRCGNTALYNSSNLFRQIDDLEPQWFYKLDEIFYHGYKQNVFIPILTLHNLKSNNENFLYVNQIKLKKISNPNKDFMEIDICCIANGEIIIGECKKTKFRKNEIKRYKQLYRQIGANKLVFVTFNENGWSEDTLNNIKDIIGEDINLELLDKHDLCDNLLVSKASVILRTK